MRRAGLLIAGLALASSGSVVPPTVQTDCGAVSGAQDTLPRTGEPVFRWSAIPFAAPPTGALRFRPPAPRACPWAGTRDGSAFAPSCVQTSGAGFEDCLYVSVYAPANHTAGVDAPLPVFVYFHGGNLINGAAPTGA